MFKLLVLMDYNKIITELSRNKDVFSDLLSGLPKEQYMWKPNPEKWCLLEICCHLHDEEREDFRTRTQYVLETPGKPLPTFDPVKWVTDRAYIRQDFDIMLSKFLAERKKSVEWLQALNNPKWDNAFNHPKFGKMTAELFLTNWLAHDYLHMRQILALKFNYLKQLTKESLTYAGNW